MAIDDDIYECSAVTTQEQHPEEKTPEKNSRIDSKGKTPKRSQLIFQRSHLFRFICEGKAK